MQKDKVQVSFGEALRYWIRLGFISFGGPAGQIAIMHKELVSQKRWISESQFLRALNFCMILPGPEAQQLATYIGWRLHGTPGGLAAGVFFVIPSIFILWLLSWFVAAFTDVPAIGGLLYGVQPVVIGIVIEAVLRIGKRTLRNNALIGLAALAFVCIYVLSVPFPLIVAGAGVAGLLLQRFAPALVVRLTHEVDSAGAPAQPVPRNRVLKLAVLYLVMLVVPIGLLALWLGPDSVFVQEGLFFTQAAFVTFGGAYAVLSYIADVAVHSFEWVTTAQMVQGLALAESTPGPLIMVTQYVGFMGAWKFHGAFDPLAAGTLGALVTTYVTFLPCFFFIFIGAPYIELLAQNHRLQAALTAVTAAVVGVVLNLAVFFTTKVLFPEGVGFDLFAAGLAIVSFVAVYRFHLPIHYVVIAGSLIGMAWKLVE